MYLKSFCPILVLPFYSALGNMVNHQITSVKSLRFKSLACDKGESYGMTNRNHIPTSTELIIWSTSQLIIEKRNQQKRKAFFGTIELILNSNF